jgi:hypothetical protein
MKKLYTVTFLKEISKTKKRLSFVILFLVTLKNDENVSLPEEGAESPPDWSSLNPATASQPWAYICNTYRKPNKERHLHVTKQKQQPWAYICNT